MTIPLAAATIATLLFVLPLLIPQFFPCMDRDRFHVGQDLPQGTGIAEALGGVDSGDAALADKDGVRDAARMSGQSADGGAVRKVRGLPDRAPVHPWGVADVAVGKHDHAAQCRTRE